MLTPHDAVIKIFRDTYSRDKDIFKTANASVDSMLTWLVGFAVAGITLIVSNFDKFTGSGFGVRIPVLCLSCTLAAGLVCRVLLYIFALKIANLEHLFSTALSELEVMNFKPVEIKEMNTDELLELMEYNFGRKIEKYNKEGEEINLEFLKSYYTKFESFAKENFYYGINRIALLLETAYQIPREETVTQFEISVGLKEGSIKKVGFNARRLQKMIGLLYLVAIVSFMICAFAICIEIYTAS